MTVSLGNDAGNGTTLLWNVQFDSPDILYYQCTTGGHGGMGGKIYIGNSGSSIDIDGHTELDTVNVSAASTFGGLLDINAGAQANTLKVEDLTDNRVVIAGAGGELEDDANLTFDGSTLAVGVDLDVDGHTELDDLNVSGVSTFQSHVHLGDDDELRFGA